MKASTLVHIGYPKSASTWLQTNFFVNKAVGFVSPVEMWGIMDQLVVPATLEFDAEATTAWFQPKVEAVWDEGYIPAISCERLAGYNLGGANDGAEIACRLQKVFPQAKVLIVIRKQADALYSAHGQIVKGLSISFTLKDFLRNTYENRTFGQILAFHYYQYDYLIRHYHFLFGVDNVLVLPYEQFRIAPQSFIKAVLTFCGQQVDEEIISHLPFTQSFNPSLSGVTVEIKRRLNWLMGAPTRYNQTVLLPSHRKNKLFLKLLLSLDRLLPAQFKRAVEERQRRDVAQLIGNTFGPSNRRTVELTGLDLAAYGYDLEDELRSV